MFDLPLISVIICAYNAESYIEHALISIVNQTYKNLEILIADDCSTDKTKNIIDSFTDSRITRFHNEKNLGYLKTCNKLFKVANGEYIAFQDADDWSTLDRIEKIMSEFFKNQELDLCGCNFIRIDENTQKVVLSSNYPTKHENIIEYFNTYNQLPFCGASVILKRNVYDQIGGYREYFDRIGYEHFDWFMLILEKFNTGNIDEKLYNYRYVANSFSRTNKLTDFKKFNADKIALFLKNQREKYGFDALQSSTLGNEFQTFLNGLEIEFWSNRAFVYKRVIFNMISNFEYKQSFVILKKGFNLNEIDLPVFAYLLYRILRSQIKRMILK